MADVDRLIALKTEQEAARDAFERCGAANTTGLTLDEQVQLDIAYKRAMRRYHEACDAYNRAIEEMI